ncbi:MAG: DUF5685 family protein, partial [Clostridia bacterium]
PQSSELLVREYELYKAVYCGICITGGKKISHFTRFFLNNDFVFLCLTRMAVTGEDISVKKKRCPYNFKSRPILLQNKSVVFTCAAFAVLMYYKALDDVIDSHGIKKILKKMTMPLFSHMKKRANKLYPELDEKIKSPLTKLYEIEKSGCASIDRVSDSFAKVTKAVCADGTDGKNNDILSECGYHLGRYIYIIDAYEDCVADEKKLEYNVLNIYYGSSQKVMAASNEIHQTLRDSIAAFCRSYEKRDDCKYDNLIYNIAQAGSETAFAGAEKNLKGITE